MTLQRSRRRWAVGALVSAYGVALLVNRSLRRVTGPSMLPTLEDGDLLVTVPVTSIRVGDVVEARDPRDGRAWVKRVAAVGPSSIRLDGRTLPVPAGRVLLLGDNPTGSTDGRVLGPTPAADVRRRVVARLPAGRRAAIAPVRNRDLSPGV